MPGLTRRLPLVLLTLATTASVAAGRSPDPPRSREWKRLITPSLTVVGNARDGDLRRTGIEIERFRQALRTLFPTLRMDSPRPTVAVVFRNHSEFTPFKPRDQRGRPRENVGGYFAVHPDVNYIVLAPHGNREFTYRVIFHEYTHFLVSRNHRRLPLWLSEGLAEFYSTFAGSERDGRTFLGRPIEEHVLVLNRRTPIPLATLTDPAKAGDLLDDEHTTHLFYAQSWALTHYLLVGEGGALRPRLGAFLAEIGRGTPAAAAFKEIFGPDLEPLGQRLQWYTKRFRLPAIQLEPGEVHLQADPEPILEIEAQQLQGDLLVRLGDYELADEHLARAEALDPLHAPTRLTRARSLLGQDEAAEALTALGSPVAGSPTEFDAEFLRAEALRAVGRYEPALEAYRRAIGLQPEAPHAYYGMSIAQTALGHAEAAASFARCRSLQPGPIWFWRRLYENLGLGLDTYAVSDALSYVSQTGWQDDSSAYAMLAAALTAERQGEEDSAARLLAEVESHVKADTWQAALVSFLQRKLSAEELVARADGRDELTEAHGYAGMLLSIDGRTDEALEHLYWVREHGRKDFVEYGMALAELKRIEGTGTEGPGTEDQGPRDQGLRVSGVHG